jgi:hypothetical protein
MLVSESRRPVPLIRAFARNYELAGRDTLAVVVLSTLTRTLRCNSWESCFFASIFVLVLVLVLVLEDEPTHWGGFENVDRVLS